MESQIILISGGTGVGTSTFAMRVAQSEDISDIISTDMAREIIRSAIHPGINPSMHKSTYLAGQTSNYQVKKLDMQRMEIIRGYKTQCAAVAVGIEGIIKRGLLENKPMIIEGAHVIPGKIREQAIFDEQRILEYHLFISDESTHKNRFYQRQKQAPKRLMSKYVNNFKEIRWIHNYMLERARRFPNIICIDNSHDLEIGVKKVIEHLH